MDCNKVGGRLRVVEEGWTIQRTTNSREFSEVIKKKVKLILESDGLLITTVRSLSLWVRLIVPNSKSCKRQFTMK